MYMNTTSKAIFKDLPLDQIVKDDNQPRRDFGTEGDENRLKVSLKDEGILIPIVVTEIAENKYLIIDGHRRVICAENLGWKEIPCRIEPKMKQGELELKRYQIQNNRRGWKPQERANALERIKVENNIDNKKLSLLVQLSTTAISNSLQLNKQKKKYKDLMNKYELDDVYQTEFIKLQPKIRRIKDIEIDDIIENIFERVRHRVISSAKEFRTLGKIFLRASANEDELYKYLKDKDMRVPELEARAVRTGFSLKIEQLTQDIVYKLQNGIKLEEKEKASVSELKKLLEDITQ